MTNIMIIIDGMTDLPSGQLNGRTSYEYADCTNMNQMRDQGAYGVFNVCPKGFSVDSLPCILSLLGVPSDQIPYGRSYFEAFYAGIPIEQDDLIFRCNLVRIENERLASACCENLSADQFAAFASIAEELTNDRIALHHMSSYKNILVVKDARKLIKDIQTFPPHENIGKKFKDIFPIDDTLNSVLSQFMKESMVQLKQDHIDTDIRYTYLPWGESIRQEIPSFFDLHRLSSVSICATEIVKGLSLAMGMQIPYIECVTADIDTDLGNKCNAVIANIDHKDFILLHINGADEAAHRKNAIEKADFIKKIDNEVVGVLLKKIPKNTNIMITSDHSTYTDTGTHVSDPQPFILYNKGRKQQGYIGSFQGTQAVTLLWEY